MIQQSARVSGESETRQLCHNGRSDQIVSLMLMVFYTALYLPSVFAQIDASEFMTIDPQSIMEALSGLTSRPYYNMNLQYHSQYYGWTYFSLNFFVLMLGKLFGFDSELATNVTVRTVLFIIGLILIYLVFKIARVFFSTFWATLAALLFLVNPISAHFFVEIHPETLGLLLQLVAIKYLLDVYWADRFEQKLFFRAVIFLSLSGLCKQYFLFANTFIYIGFFIAFANCTEVGRAAMNWRLFWSLTLRGAGIFIAILFLIHPYAIIDPIKFIKIQLALKGDHAGRPLADAAGLWVDQIKASVLISVNILLLTLIPFLRKSLLPYKLSLAFTVIVGTLFAANATTFVNVNYLYPLQLFFVFNLFFFIVNIFGVWACAISSGFEKFALRVVVVVLSIGLISNTAFALYSTHSRYFLDGLNTKSVTWFLFRDMPADTRIAYSPNLAILEPLKSTACHAWQGCADVKALTTYDPDYVAFSPSYKHFDSAAYSQFVSQNDYSLVDEIRPQGPTPGTACKASYATMGDTNISVPHLLQFYILNAVVCFHGYQDAIAAWNTGHIVEGEDVLIYKKGE